MNEIQDTKQKKGFTLLELILSLVLLGIVASMGLAILVTGLEGYNISNTNSEIATELKPALDELTLFMSDIVDVQCFTANTQMTVTNTDGGNATLLVGNGTVGIQNMLEIGELTGQSLTMTMDGSNIQKITLIFTKTASGTNFSKTFSLKFSPRTILSAPSACP